MLQYVTAETLTKPSHLKAIKYASPMHMLPETLTILPTVQISDFQCYSVGVVNVSV